MAFLTLELFVSLFGSLPPFKEQKDFDINYTNLSKEEKILFVI